MITPEIEKLLLSFDDPDLTRSQREQLDDLVETSPEAKEYLRQLQSLNHQMEMLGVGLDSIDLSDFAQAVNQKIDATRSARSTRRPLWHWLAPLSAAAAIIMVALPWFNPPTTTTTVTPQAIAKVVLTQPATIASDPVVQVALSYAPPAPAKAPIVQITLASQHMSTAPNPQELPGEIICFAGPILHRQPIKPNTKSNNNYLVF